MKMRHLCGRHYALVQRNAEQAVQLWYGAFNNGVEAYRARRWREASQFLGTAWEIALVRFAQDIPGGQPSLDARQFAAVGRYYANVLCQQEDFAAAEICLRRVHDGLLHWCRESKLPYHERTAAYEQLAEFRQKLTALLNCMGRGAEGQCLDLMARQLAADAAHGLIH